MSEDGKECLNFVIELSSAALRFDKDKGKVLTLLQKFMHQKQLSRHKLLIIFEHPNTLTVTHQKNKNFGVFEKETITKIIEKTILESFRRECRLSFSDNTVEMIQLVSL